MMSKAQESFVSLMSLPHNGERRSDSFASLESEEEDQLRRVEQREIEARVNAMKIAVRDLEECEDSQTARIAAYKLLHSMDQQMAPYLMVELWLQVREMVHEWKVNAAQANSAGTSSPTSTRVAYRQTNAQAKSSKLGTIALPSAKEIDLPEFDHDASSNESDGSNPQPGEEAARNSWNAVLGSTTTTHQDLLNQLATTQQQSSRLQVASETEDDDAVDLDMTATSYPLLTIHGDEQDKDKQHEGAKSPQHTSKQLAKSPRRAQPQKAWHHRPAQQEQEFMDLGTLKYSGTDAEPSAGDFLEIDVHSSREQQQLPMRNFSRFALHHHGVQGVDGDDEVIVPTSSTDPTTRTDNGVIPDMLTSNDDLNEEIIASLTRLTEMYQDDAITAPGLRFPKFSELNEGFRHKPSRFVDKNGRALEDDDNDVYQHYFGATADALGQAHQHAGYSFTVPTAHEFEHPRRVPTGKKVRRKAPTPTASSLSTPRKGIRSFARKDGNKPASSSPLAQGPRRVISSSRQPTSSARPSSARPTAASNVKTVTARRAAVAKPGGRSKH